MKNCPCGNKSLYQDCCGAYIEKLKIPETPEALMRSRYTAFVEKNADYIQKTMREPALLEFDRDSIENGDENWLGLEVLKSYFDSNNNDIGYVEFKAYFSIYDHHKKTTKLMIHELSEFHRIDNHWYYIKGSFFKH